MDRHLSVSETARIIGVTTGTLRKWRCQGKGPKGYFHLSETRGVYPEREVSAWLAEMKGAK